MKWHKQANNQDSHPDILAAGFWGGVVFRCICRVSGEFDLGGSIPAKYSTPRFIARRLGLSRDCHVTGDPVEIVGDALSEILALGLVESSEDNGVEIPGWKEMQGDTGASRQRSLRASRDGHATVTLPSGPEEKRVEEKRETKSPSKPDPVLLKAEEVIGKSGRGWRKPHKFLTARIRDGASVEDCLLVVSHQTAEWEGSEKMRKFIRQKTLFSAENFDGYLEDAQGGASEKIREPTLDEQKAMGIRL